MLWSGNKAYLRNIICFLIKIKMQPNSPVKINFLKNNFINTGSMPKETETKSSKQQIPSSSKPIFKLKKEVKID